MPDVTSPGHKLGQMLGNFFESVFSKKLAEFATEHGFYCDKKGLRPAVRGKRKKVTWVDSQGNKHDLDYVFEKDGTDAAIGQPVAFIELAWRRYTKHSRNKAGEIEGALVHLGNSYGNTCRFLGAILCGEFTEGAINQLESHKIHAIYIPYERVVEAFMIKDINLDYPENAPNQNKYQLIHAVESLSENDMREVKESFVSSIQKDYGKFMELLEKSLLRRVKSVIIVGLYGSETTYNSVSDAIHEIENFDMTPSPKIQFCKFEIYLKFTNGDRIDGSFQEREGAVAFLRLYE